MGKSASDRFYPHRIDTSELSANREQLTEKTAKIAGKTGN
jgi:hypothetical protein